MVIYGVNGSGRSSFVEAVEFVLNDGKIGHLAHEYSVTRQQKAIPNTHRPQGRRTELTIKFKDNSEHRAEIKENGSSTGSGAEAAAMASWGYRRTVLRQDEVAAFIHDTKGDKYSPPLPWPYQTCQLSPSEVCSYYRSAVTPAQVPEVLSLVRLWAPTSAPSPRCFL